MKTNSWVVKTVSVLLILVASLSLFLAQSSYWVNHTVFNQSNFSTIVSGAVLEQSSRDAVAAEVVDTALQERPVAQRLIGDRAQSLVSSLLGTDFAAQAVNKVVNVTYKYVTTPNRDDIKIELAGITAPILAVLNLAQANDSNAAQRIENIPDEIVLVESDAFPDLSGTVSLMLWVGPLFWLLAISGFAVYIYLHRTAYTKAVYVVGVSVAIVALLGILTRPILPAPISSMVPISNLRPVVENVTDAFLISFQAQMTTMFIIAIVSLVIFSQRRLISRWVQKLGSMIARESVPVETKPTTTSSTKKSTKPKTTKKK